jgi:hypothetical protein
MSVGQCKMNPLRYLNTENSESSCAHKWRINLLKYAKTR